MRIMLVTLCVLSSLLAASCGSRDTAAPGTLRIAVVPKGSTHEHWKRVRIGAEKAAAEDRAAGVPVDVLRKGELKGFVVQNPVNMGYLSVKTMVDHLRGHTVPKSVDTGVLMVTLENLNAPEIQAVINPPEAR